MNKLAEIELKTFMLSIGEIYESIYSGIIKINQEYNFSKMSIVGGAIVTAIPEVSVNFEKTKIPVILNGFVNYLGTIKCGDLQPISIWHDPYMPHLQLIIYEGDNYITANIVDE